MVMPAAEAGLQRGTLVMPSSERSLPAVAAAANMLAMVFLDSQSTNYDSRNDLRFAHHVQHPVQKQGRPVSNQRSGQAKRSEWDE
jgi:hypothetical protein